MGINRSGWLASLAALLLLSSNVSVAAQPRAVDGQLLVKLANTSTLRSAHAALDSDKYEVVSAVVPELGWYLVKIKTNTTPKAAAAELTRMDDVLAAQADHVATLRETAPNDADFVKQWALKNSAARADIRATQAWDLGTGGKDRDGNDIVVAIVDGGMDLAHQDLASNLFVNTGEIPGDGIDNDGNGYVDDVNGWNAYNGTGTIPSNSHGTHVAGIAGASGNNDKHVAGVNWNVKIMPVAASSGKTSVIAAGYGYVLKMKKLWIESGGKQGANVVATNSSFGVDYGKCESGEFPMWNDLYNAMGEVGILSAAATANLNIDVDVKGDVPTGCSSAHLINVTNTTDKDKKNSGAGYGLKSIHIGAPGTNIWSTLPKDRVGSLTGTSMATPHIAGAVAFLHSVASSAFHTMYTKEPARGNAELKAILLKTVDPIEDLAGKTVSGGRLNLDAAAKAIHAWSAQ